MGAWVFFWGLACGAACAGAVALYYAGRCKRLAEELRRERLLLDEARQAEAGLKARRRRTAWDP